MLLFLGEDRAKEYRNSKGVKKFLQEKKIVSEETLAGVNLEDETQLASIRQKVLDAIIDKHLNDRDEEGNQFPLKLFKMYSTIADNFSRSKLEIGEYLKIIEKIVENPRFKGIHEISDEGDTVLTLAARYSPVSLVDKILSRKDVTHIPHPSS